MQYTDSVTMYGQFDVVRIEQSSAVEGKGFFSLDIPVELQAEVVSGESAEPPALGSPTHLLNSFTASLDF